MEVELLVLGSQLWDVFSNLGDAALHLVSKYGFLAVALFTFLESSLIFPLVPSEVVIPGAAVLLIGGPVTFALFVTAVVIGTTAGSLFAYYVFATHGRSALERYGRSFHISEGELERASRWFHHWGEHSVFWGRLLPVLRSVVSVPAGIAEMSRWKFTLYTALGALVFGAGVAALVVTGMKLWPFV